MPSEHLETIKTLSSGVTIMKLIESDSVGAGANKIKLENLDPEVFDWVRDVSVSIADSSMGKTQEQLSKEIFIALSALELKLNDRLSQRLKASRYLTLVMALVMMIALQFMRELLWMLFS